MFADPKKVGIRRLKRRLKAGASIVIALCAGAFLACKGGAEDPGPSPSGPDARPGPDRARGSADAESGESQADDAGVSADAGATMPGDAGASDAMVVRDAAADAADARAPRVDKKEHRKGMPVRDNLLE